MASYHSPYFFCHVVHIVCKLIVCLHCVICTLRCFMFSVFLMLINIRIVFGLHILYLYIHCSCACFNQCNNFGLGTYGATVNQHDTLVDLIHPKIHFINMSNNFMRQLYYTFFFK